MPDKKLEAAIKAFDSGDDSALVLIRELARQGVPRAQFHLGVAYQNGWGVEENRQEAFKWLSRAAEACDPEAQYLLASILTHDEADYGTEQAMSWLRKAAEQGHVEAQRDLGAYLATGELCAKDEREALAWYLRAASQGHADAQYNAGMMLLEGEGCEVDQDKGRYWLEAAAGNGDTMAMEVLGVFHEEGYHGYPRDARRAMEWYEASAREGSARAKFCLGMIYLEGLGIPKDVSKGLALIREADEEGYLYARDVLDANRSG